MSGKGKAPSESLMSDNGRIFLTTAAYQTPTFAAVSTGIRSVGVGRWMHPPPMLKDEWLSDSEQFYEKGPCLLMHLSASKVPACDLPSKTIE